MMSFNSPDFYPWKVFVEKFLFMKCLWGQKQKKLHMSLLHETLNISYLKVLSSPAHKLDHELWVSHTLPPPERQTHWKWSPYWVPFEQKKKLSTNKHLVHTPIVQITTVRMLVIYVLY